MNKQIFDAKLAALIALANADAQALQVDVIHASPDCVIIQASASRFITLAFLRAAKFSDWDFTLREMNSGFCVVVFEISGE